MEPDVVVSPFAKPRAAKLAPGSVVGAALIVLLLAVGVTVLGGARTWILLPMFGLAAGLILLQFGRIAAGPGLGIGRLVRPDVIDALAFLFLAYATIRYATAPIEYTARIEWMTILSGGIVFWTARYGLVRSGHGLIILWGLTGIAFAEALFSIWLSFNPDFKVWGETLNIHYYPRFLGSFGCPNHYGAFLYMGTFSALALAFFLPQEHRLPKLLLLLAAVTMAFGVAFSLSRGSWIGFFAGFVVFAIFCVKNGKIPAKGAWIAVGGLLLLAGAWALISPDVQGRLSEMTAHLSTLGGNQSLDGYIRIVLAHDAWRIICDYFWFGSGPGTFAFLHPRYQDALYSTLAIYPHDDYLNTWSDYGFVGFLLAFGFANAVVAAMWLRVRSRRSGSWGRRALLGAGLASWTALMLHETLDFNFHIPVDALAGLTLAGLALRANGGEAAVSYEGKWAKRTAKIAAVAGVFLSCFFVARLTETARGYYPFFRIDAQKGEAIFPEAEIALTEALRFDPRAWEAQALLGDYCRAEAVKQADEKDRMDLAQKAVTAYLGAIALNPYDDGLLVRLGLTYDEMGRFDEAYIAYSKAIARRPYNGFYHAYLGLHFWRRGGMKNFVRAEKEFETGRNCPYGQETAFAYQKQFAQYRLQMAAQAPVPPAPAATPTSTPVAPAPTAEEKGAVPEEADPAK
ncbi:O-antigen ligase [Verrucomicrobium sp. GAS474]|uniref:O-antigen ligase family protein n=1 Tax=Verrucomicrobium sp. GAS474 TaxID=1882831 RepID=UPI00087A550E|nr:O-antigen ligase family protein [Verrucomicrobium sp. GAS474]SDT96478.1 O-antigen ligase [Verrucomicrobium sp. GAS474]